MKIYTRTGDDGTTGLFGAGRVLKYSPRIEAYGTTDELNSVIGICTSLEGADRFEPFLGKLQVLLFILGADLATPYHIDSKVSVPRIKERHISMLETKIDEYEEALEPLRRFILPGGNQLAAQFHFARTVARRAERLMVLLALQEEINANAVPFINRLSDLLFVMARTANKNVGMKELEWDGQTL